MRLTTIENCKILHWFNCRSFFLCPFLFTCVCTSTLSHLVLDKARRTHGQCPKSIPLYHHNWVSSLKIQIIFSHCPIHLCFMSKAMAIAHQITYFHIKDTQSTRLKNIYIKVNLLICAAIWVKHKTHRHKERAVVGHGVYTVRCKSCVYVCSKGFRSYRAGLYHRWEVADEFALDGVWDYISLARAWWYVAAGHWWMTTTGILIPDFTSTNSPTIIIIHITYTRRQLALFHSPRQLMSPGGRDEFNAFSHMRKLQCFPFLWKAHI